MTPPALRGALLLALLGLVILGLPTRRERGVVPRLAGEGGDEEAIAALLLDPDPPAAVFRDAGRAPTERELQALAAVAERAPLLVALRAPGPSLTVTPPDAPRTGRYGAVAFTASAVPADTIVARLLDPGDQVLDSVAVVADEGGSVHGGFRVRPPREGWTEWRVQVARQGDGNGQTASAGAWVAGAGAPRVLVVSGPPSWESRYVVRALERSGAEVSLVQRLGRDNVLTSGAAIEDWGTAEALAAYDVAVLLPGAAPDPRATAALEAWVEEGRGLLEAAGSGSTRRAIRADELAWSAPAAIAPLPPADIAAVVSPVGAAGPGASVALEASGGPGSEPLLTLIPAGRGRTALLGILETWRWVMEAGLDEEHRAFWRSLVDWLAVPSADSLGVRIEPIEAGAGSMVEVISRGAPLALHRPEAGAGELLPSVDEESHRTGRFVAVDSGLHRLGVAGSTVAAFVARPAADGAPANLARARLSLLAAASGGEALEADAFEARVAATATSEGRGRWWAAGLFALLVLLATAEWMVRRLGGLR